MLEQFDLDLGGGRTLHGVQAGQGPDVVLIHGLLATSHDWLAGPFEAMVAEGWRVTAIDRPGCGRSRRPRFGGTPRDQAKQIRAGLSELGIQGPVLVSHSFGGLVSLAFAELFPEVARHLVLAAPVAFPEPRLMEHTLLAPRSIPFFGPAFSHAAEKTFDKPVLKIVQKLMFSPQAVPGHWEESYPYEKILDAEALVFEGEDSAAILPFAPTGIINVARIATPAHVLTGTSDKIVEDERQGKLLARLMPNARLIEVDGIGHMVHHARTDLVIDAVRDALASAQAQSSAR